MSNNFYQAFNSISDSMTKTVPKEIKMTNEPKKIQRAEKKFFQMVLFCEL